MISGKCPHCQSENQLAVDQEWYGPQIYCVICGWEEYNPVEPKDRDLRKDKEGMIRSKDIYVP